MKSFNSRLALFFLGLLIALCHSCMPTEQPAAVPAGEPKVSEVKQPVVKVPLGPSDVVAKIGDYVITRAELERRLMAELRPDPEAERTKVGPVDAKTVLMKMVAEKAMIMEARRENYLQDEGISESIERFRGKRLVNLLLRTHLQDKLTVTGSEIDEKVKSDPRLNRARAEAGLRKERANVLVGRFYNEICERLHVRKLKENFPRVAEIYQRLLSNSAKRYKMPYVRIRQMDDELTQEEKDLPLVEFDNGKVTLKDWLNTLGEYAPPSHPKDLHTVEGVERLLDHAMRTPIFVAEAESRGLHKDGNFVKQLREREDLILLGQIRREKLKNIKEPTAEQVIDYFNNNKEKFAIPEMLKIDQIWCQDLKTARRVKARLDRGDDFESVRQKYSLVKRDKPFNTNPGREGVFFEDLWSAEPNEIVGPVKGFYRQGIEWRVVKILQKRTGEPREYSSNLEFNIKDRMQNEQMEEILAEYRKELLEKYPYEIYSEGLADIDPLGMP